MGQRSKSKGARWEWELAREFRAAMPGANVQRGLSQSRDGAEVPDVDLPVFWLEAKVGKKPNIRGALRQARAASNGKGRWPLAVVKDDGGAPVAAMYLDDFRQMAGQWWEGRLR